MRIVRLKASLTGIRPAIWRRLELPADLTVNGLHQCLQKAFGWTDTHLHHFRIKDLLVASPASDPDGEMDYLDSCRQPLWELEGKVTSFNYTYDFGDNWVHSIKIEAWTGAETGVKYPRCTGGARARPPEDCGDYEDLLEALKDPKHDRHKEVTEWVGDFDPEVFDLAVVNLRLNKIRIPPHKPGPGPWAREMASQRNSTVTKDDQYAVMSGLAKHLQDEGDLFTPQLQKALLDFAAQGVSKLKGTKKI